MSERLHSIAWDQTTRPGVHLSYAACGTYDSVKLLFAMLRKNKDVCFIEIHEVHKGTLIEKWVRT